MIFLSNLIGFVRVIIALIRISFHYDSHFTFPFLLSCLNYYFQ